MFYDIIMVRFGELSTKGKNKNEFIRTLFHNIKNALRQYEKLSYEMRYDHIYINLNGEDVDTVVSDLKEVSGIHSLSLVKKIESNIDLIKSSCLDAIKDEDIETFKIKCKRSNKAFEFNSDQIVRIVAGEILRNCKFKVDVHNPDFTLSIEVREEGTYIFSKTIKAIGGYPLGTNGKVMHMLSGGIDSPVAAYLLMKRGIKINCIHFASPPYTNSGVIEKLKDLLTKLNKYQDSINLYIIPFTKIQEKIYEVGDESYAITIMRRMMYRFADRLAKKTKCLAVSNGESVGQVASQTLDSIKVINDVTNIPVLRPLLTFDKEEIIDIARKINTYEISIRPFEDCCTIFDPKNPKTKPSLDKVIEIENKFDYESMINEALLNVQKIVVKPDDNQFEI